MITKTTTTKKKPKHLFIVLAISWRVGMMDWWQKFCFAVENHIHNKLQMSEYGSIMKKDKDADNDACCYSTTRLLRPTLCP